MIGGLMIKIDGFIVVRKDHLLDKSSVFNTYHELYDRYADAQAVIDKIGLAAFCVIPVCLCDDGIYQYYLRVPDCIHI